MASPSTSTSSPPSTALASATPAASNSPPEGRNSIIVPVTVVVVVLAAVSAAVMILLICLYKKRRCKQDESNEMVHSTACYSSMAGKATSSSDPLTIYETIPDNIRPPPTIATANLPADTEYSVATSYQSTTMLLEADNPLYVSTSTDLDIGIEEASNILTEESVYWVPETNIASLYQQLHRRKFVEVPAADIEIQNLIGQGNFAKVLLATWKKTKLVAVKILKESSLESSKVKFLQEAAIMGQFHHPNVVELHGVVTVGESVMIVLEYMKNGDLLNFLPNIVTNNIASMDKLPIFLIKICCQVASGMEYLSRKSFAHRDLAARNILVSEKYQCKVGDFGMARDLMDENYYISQGGKIPVRWTAPEALNYKKYSTASDVWSYGVVLFEIWSLGKKPYAGLHPMEVIDLIDSGQRMYPPPGCPETIYEMMIDCWNYDSSKRPSFTNILESLSMIDDDGVMNLPQGSILGEDLEKGKQLHFILQQRYQEYT